MASLPQPPPVFLQTPTGLSLSRGEYWLDPGTLPTRHFRGYLSYCWSYSRLVEYVGCKILTMSLLVACFSRHGRYATALPRGLRSQIGLRGHQVT